MICNLSCGTNGLKLQLSVQTFWWPWNVGRVNFQLLWMGCAVIVTYAWKTARKIICSTLP